MTHFNFYFCRFRDLRTVLTRRQDWREFKLTDWPPSASCGECSCTTLKVQWSQDRSSQLTKAWLHIEVGVDQYHSWPEFIPCQRHIGPQPDNIPLSTCFTVNSYPKSTCTKSTCTKSTRTQVNSYPSQVVPTVNSYPNTKETQSNVVIYVT